MAKGSPVVETRMDFPSALGFVIKGRRITKLEWNDKDSYGMMRGGFLMLYRNGEWYRWILSDGDLLGQDWVICQE